MIMLKFMGSANPHTHTLYLRNLVLIPQKPKPDTLIPAKVETFCPKTNTPVPQYLRKNSTRWVIKFSANAMSI